MAASGGAPRRDARIVGFVLVLGVLLTAGWFATGHASAPDRGLQQIDVLSLHERVPGVEAVRSKPTMVVLACSGSPQLPERYGVVVHRRRDPGYHDLARALALPDARDCRAGYALVDPAGFVRYRSYDPGWAAHSDEQSVLLDAL
ncbi:MAG: hypothetical protein JWN77_142 [Frankiales bacterium]|jgi:hypothetical protein|nr:hypothetical protein [Frankiales bacterium]